MCDDEGAPIIPYWDVPNLLINMMAIKDYDPIANKITSTLLERTLGRCEYEFPFDFYHELLSLETGQTVPVLFQPRIINQLRHMKKISPLDDALVKPLPQFDKELAEIEGHSLLCEYSNLVFKRFLFYTGYSSENPQDSEFIRAYARLEKLREKAKNNLIICCPEGTTYQG